MRVLDVDRDLAEVLDDRELEKARPLLVAPAITLARGHWSPREAAPAGGAPVGMLVMEGALCREVAVGHGICAEIVGPGDLIGPWEEAGSGLLVSCDVRWRVLEEARIAMLGEDFAAVAAAWPALTGALVGRAVGRAHALALSATISSTTGLETRLLMLLWQLADRWGRVRRDGVMVPIRMTHELIARLVGARRPSVSTALKQLEREQLVRRLPRGGWLLTGPGEPSDLFGRAARQPCA